MIKALRISTIECSQFGSNFDLSGEMDLRRRRGQVHWILSRPTFFAKLKKTDPFAGPSHSTSCDPAAIARPHNDHIVLRAHHRNRSRNSAILFLDALTDFLSLHRQRGFIKRDTALEDGRIVMARARRI
jgi:hypothetical protein